MPKSDYETILDNIPEPERHRLRYGDWSTNTMPNRQITLQLNIDTMQPGKGLVSHNPKDPRQRVLVECLSKSTDGDLIVIEAKVTVIAPRSVGGIIVPDMSLLTPQ